jgi:hypothetical protein
MSGSITVRGGNVLSNYNPNKLLKLGIAPAPGELNFLESLISDDGVGITITGNLNVTGTTTGASGTAKYAADFTASTLTILGTTHGLGNKDLIVTYRDASGNKIEPTSENIHPTTFTLTAVFGQSTIGRVTMIG